MSWSVPHATQLGLKERGGEEISPPPYLSKGALQSSSHMPCFSDVEWSQGGAREERRQE